jgi:trk system potassium uptake protein TrkA
MFVLIAGGGRTGTYLAAMLGAEGRQVRLIEDRRDVLSRIHRELPTEVIYEGSPTDPAVLERAGISEAQAVVAATTNDSDNLVICFLARTRYNVPRTIARINNPRSAWLFDQKFRVDVAVNQAAIMASLIEEEMSWGDMMTLLKIRRGRYSLVEEKIPEGARAIGVAIKDLALPEECVIAAIIRQGRVIIPRGITELEVGDEVLAVVGPGAAEKLADLLSRAGGNGSTANGSQH